MCESGSVSDVDEEIAFAKLKFCKKRTKKAPVFITEFTNGRIRSDDLNRIEFECFKSDDDTDKINVGAKRCMLANNGHLTYSGTSQHTKKSPLQYFVGVRDRNTGKMRLYDTTIFRMKPVLDKTEPESTQSTSKTFKESQQALTDSFGSKIKKRTMNMKLKNRVSEESMNETLPSENISLESFSEVPIIRTDAQSINYMPTPNRAATSPEEVFDISDIISPQESHALEKEAEILLSDPNVFANKLNTFCNYVQEHFREGETDLTKATYLIYYEFLVTLQHVKAVEMRRKDPIPTVPEPFKSNILGTYAVDGNNESGRRYRSFPQHMKDKLVAHILVLALFIDDFSVNIRSVLNNLYKVDGSKLILIAQTLGCHISNLTRDNQVSKFAVLKIPLYVCNAKYSKKGPFA